MEQGDFTLLNAQLAVFFERNLKKPESFYSELDKELGSIFDQTPIIIPIPEDDPNLGGVPVVQMRSSNPFACNLAYARADFLCLGKGSNQRFDSVQEYFLEKSENFVQFFRKKDYKIKRIGFITRFFILSDNADKRISMSLKPSFFESQKGDVIETHITNATTFTDEETEIKTNFLVSLNRTKSTIFEVGSDLDGIELLLDVNTSPEKFDEYVEKVDANFVRNFIERNTAMMNPGKFLEIMQ